MALCLASVGVAAAISAWTMPFGRPELPGPGVMPFAVGCLLALFGVALAVLALVRRTEGDAKALELGHRDTLVALAALVLISILFEPLGAPIAAALLLGGLFRVVGRVSIWLAVAGGVFGAVFVWFFFVKVLSVTLPLGPFLSR